MAEENQGQEVAVEAAQEDAPELDSQEAQQAQGEPEEPPVGDVPEDAITDEEEGINPPDGAKEEPGSKRTRQDEGSDA